MGEVAEKGLEIIRILIIRRSSYDAQWLALHFFNSMNHFPARTMVDPRCHSPANLRNRDRAYHAKKLLALAKLPTSTVMKTTLLLRHLWLLFLSSQASSKRLPRFTLRLTVDRPHFLSAAPCAAATRRRRWPNFMDQPRGETSSKKAMASLEVELRERNEAFEQPCLQGALQEV